MNAIELYQKMSDPLDAIDRMGSWMAKSGMFGCERLEQGQVLAFACLAEGKSPLEIRRTYHLLNGELSMRADAMLAELRKRGGRHVVISRTAELAQVQITFDGQTMDFRCSWEEAQAEPFTQTKEGKLRKQWATPRARTQTLWARAISEGVRTMAPEIVAGTYAPEEIDDAAADVPPATIVLSPTAPTTRTPVAAVIPAQSAIEVTVMPPTDAEAEADAGLAPSTQPAPTPPTPQPAAATDDARASVAEMAALEDLVGPHYGKAMEWFAKEKWLEAGQTPHHLTSKRVRRLLAQRGSWLRAIGVKEGQ